VKRLGLALALSLTWAIAPSAAHAHGREPALGAVVFDPTDPSHIVVRTTWTFLESYDGGASWFWRCAVAVGYERTTEDPPIAIAGDGTVVAGIFNGLVRSADSGCRYEPSTDPDVNRLYVIDLVLDPVDPHTLWGITSPGDRANTVVRSTDDGATWELRGTPDPSVLLERIRVAPSDPSRIYTSGSVPRRGDVTRRALFFASSDGGQTFVTTEIALEGDERNVHVLAVDPTNPDRVLLRMTRLVTDEVPERLLLTEDGGLTFVTAASVVEITGVAFSDDGTTAWVGGWDGAFLRSDLGGAAGSFVPVAGQEALRVRCLAYHAGELWVCADDLRYDYALGTSSDGGTTIERLWGFLDARVDTNCPACSAVGGICPTYWPDVVFDLGLPGGMDGSMPGPDAGRTPCDADIDATFDAGMGSDTGPPPGAGCACSLDGAASPRPMWIGIGVFLTALLSWGRRRAQRRGSRRCADRGGRTETGDPR
jgi:hypothetical protein